MQEGIAKKQKKEAKDHHTDKEKKVRPLSQTKLTGVVVFKKSRSGSTWFGSMLSHLSNVTFSGEVFSAYTSACLNDFSNEQLESYLRAVITLPGDKPGIGYYKRHVNELDDFIHQESIVSKGNEKYHEVVGGFVALDCQLNYHKVFSEQPAPKLVLFLRTNVVKKAVAVYHDDPAYKVCEEKNRLRRRRHLLGSGHNLNENCIFNTNLTTLAVADMLAEISAALWSNENLFKKTEALELTYMTIYYEDLQQDPIVQLKRFKAYAGLGWTRQDDLALSASAFVKATSEDVKPILGDRLVQELDTVFRRPLSLVTADDEKASIHNDEEPTTLISTCLHNMLHTTTPTTFDRPCTAYYDHKKRLQGLNIQTFCEGFVTQLEISRKVRRCKLHYAAEEDSSSVFAEGS